MKHKNILSAQKWQAQHKETDVHTNDQVKKNEMGRTCGTYGGEERCIQGFSGET
jgi:hypothetical protein